MAADKCVLNLLREVVSVRAGHRCEFPGCLATECDPHHIFSRENKSTRYDANNCVWLCNDHHRYAEAHPEAFHVQIIAQRGPEWWDDLVRRKNQIVKFNDIFRTYWKESLQQELRRLAA